MIQFKYKQVMYSASVNTNHNGQFHISEITHLGFAGLLLPMTPTMRFSFGNGSLIPDGFYANVDPAFMGAIARSLSKLLKSQGYTI